MVFFKHKRYECFIIKNKKQLMQIKKKEVLLKEIIKILDDNKAKDIVTIDLANKSSIADYMIVASGTSSRHIQSVSENTIEELKKMGIKGCKVEGRDSDNWKLIDAIDVIVHIFHHEQRKNYELEKMWADICLLYTSPSPRDRTRSRMPSSA